MRLGGTPGLPRLIVGGSSSGCRLATVMALRHRDAIRALLMMRVTGGAFAVKRLSHVLTQYSRRRTAVEWKRYVAPTTSGI